MERHRIFISAGHTNTPGDDMGATGIDGTMEGNLTVELRNLVLEELHKLHVHSITDSDNYNLKEDIAIINTLLDIGDIAIDIHFNAFFNPNVKGTEVLIPNEFSTFEKELAKRLADGISSILKTIDRLVKTESESHHSRLGFMRPNCENILIEVCFITNQEDLNSYRIHKNEVATFIAKCISEYVTPEPQFVG